MRAIRGKMIDSQSSTLDGEGVLDISFTERPVMPLAQWHL